MFITHEQGYRIISLTGEIHYGNSRTISKELLSHIHADYYRYILDVSRLASIDSTGLAILFSFSKKCYTENKESMLVAGEAPWYKLLHYSKLDRVLRVYPDVLSAITACEAEYNMNASILEY